MNIYIALKVLFYLIFLNSVSARRRRGGIHIRKIHVDGKAVGKGLLKGLHVAEKIAASGALGPQFKAAAIAAQTAETAIRGIVQGKSAKQIAEESAMTAAGGMVGGGMKEKLLRMVAKKIGINVPPQTGSEDTNFSNKLMSKVKNKLAEHGINDPSEHVKEMMTEHIKENMHEFIPNHATDNHDQDQHNYGQHPEHINNTNSATRQNSVSVIDHALDSVPNISPSHSLSHTPSLSPIHHNLSSKKKIDSDGPNLMKAPPDYFPFISPNIYDQLYLSQVNSMQYQYPRMYDQYPTMYGQSPSMYMYGQYPSMHAQYSSVYGQYPNMYSQYPTMDDQNSNMYNQTY